MSVLDTIKTMDGQDLYRRWTKPAEWLKVFLQMLVGIAAVIVIVIILINDMRGGHTAVQIAKHSLQIIAASLAVAASLELAYTLFTDGPDEVIDPLMMGISATLLYLVSSSGALTWSDGIAIVLFAGTLALLFAVRRRFIDKSDVRQGQRERRIAWRAQVDKLFVERKEAEAALALLELAEFAWHDLYGDGPPKNLMNEILASPCQLADLVVAVRSAVEKHGILTAEVPSDQKAQA